MNGTGTAAEDRGTRRPRALEAARRYSHFVSRNRWWVALGVVAVTAVALLPVPDLLRHVTTNRGALQNPDEPARLRFDEVVRRFGTTFLNTVIIEGRDREAMRRAADRIAATLTAPPPEGETPRDPCTDTRFAARQVRDVLYKVDLDEFERRGIYYLSAEDIEKLGEAFAAADTAPGRSAAPPLTGLQAMLDGVADGIETGTATPDSDDAGNAAVIDRLADAVERLRRWLDAPYPHERLGESAAPRLTEEDRRGVDEAGYISEGTDPVLMFLFVRPVSDSEDEDVFRCFTRIVREAVREGIAAAGPGAGRIRALVTGMPALVSDDMDVIVADSSRVTMISGAAILTLLLLYFRSIRTTVALFVPLLVGLAWTLGFTAVAVGRLTVITAYFGAILFGLGVDYAIQLLMRYDDEIRAGRVREEAWAQALANTGGGVLTGAATTALTFYAIGFTEFEGFAELGIIAGTGVVAIFTATAIALPLLLFFVHRTRDRRVTLDLGMVRLLRARPSRIAVLVVAGIVVVGGFGSLARRVFDYDPIRLMARDAESVAGAEMLLGTDFSHETAIATAPTQAAAAELAAQLERLSKTTGDPAGAGRACPDKPPTISRIESLDRYARFLPEMSRRKADAVDAIARHRELLVRMRSQAAAAAASPPPVNPARAAAAVERIADSAGNVAFDLRGSRPGSPLAAALTRLAGSAEDLAGRIQAGPPDLVAERLAGFQKWLLDQIDSGLDIVLAGLSLNPTAVRALPAEIEDRFRSRDGAEYAVYVHPTGNVGDFGFLRCFVADLHSVDPRATGFPVTHLVFATMVERSFEEATAFAFFAVVLCLLVHMRSGWQVLTAMSPLLVGIALAIGVQSLAGIPFNFVNVMALPVLLGTGVDYGIYLVHRYRERPGSAEGLAGTATAITLSALTTTIGFGALMYTSHRGMWSLGFGLTVGIAGCLAAAQLVVPVVLSMARGGRAPEDGPEGGRIADGRPT